METDFLIFDLAASGSSVLCISGAQLNSIMQEDLIGVIVTDCFFIGSILRLRQTSITC